jgi:hypothetical protein
MLPSLAVERLYKQRTPLAKESVIFALGVNPGGWSDVNDKTLEEYEKLTHEGGRMAIAFLPARPPSKSPDKPPAAEARWHIKLLYAKDVDTGRGDMPRRSALYFESGSEWKILSQRDGFATGVERDLGAGSIVLVADSYPLSNEGLRESRDAEFIAKLVGQARRVIFDENHFGVVESGSVTTLMRKYRLEGSVAMLALVAGLFLWRSASSFLPPRQRLVAGIVVGRDSNEGLSALLRRGIPEKELLDVCLGEWGKWRGVAPPHIDNGNPVEAYRNACKILTEKR